MAWRRGGGDIEGVKGHSEGASSGQWKGIIPALTETVSKAVGDLFRFPWISFTSSGCPFLGSHVYYFWLPEAPTSSPQDCLRLHCFADAESQSAWEISTPITPATLSWGWLGQEHECPAPWPAMQFSFHNQAGHGLCLKSHPCLTPSFPWGASLTFLWIPPRSTSLINYVWIFVSTSASITPTPREDFNFVAF